MTALPHNWIWFQFSLGEQEIMFFIYYLLSTLIDPWAFPLVRWNASLYSHFQDLLHHFSESTKNNQVFGWGYKVIFIKKNLVQTSSWKLQICVVRLSQNVNLLTWASQCFAQYKWWSIKEKDELILWKLSFIQMKILNDITCNLN